MITIIQKPALYTLEDNTFAFYYDPNENILVTEIFSGPATCCSPHILVIASSYNECKEYIYSNNITIPEWAQQ